MYRSILVPLDGSSFAEQALRFAVDLARRDGAALHLVVVHQPMPSWAKSVQVGELELKARGAEHAYLEATAGNLSAEGVATVIPALLESPERHSLAEYAVQQGFDHHLLNRPASHALADYVVANQIELVVIAAHGRGALGRFWVGSVTDYLVRHLTVPQLLIRPRAEDTPSAGLRPAWGKVLIPLDRSTSSEAVIDVAVELAGTAARYTLLNVVEAIYPPSNSMGPLYPSGPDLEILEEIREGAESYVRQLTPRLSERGVVAEGHAVLGDDAASVILEQAALANADLIAMTIHGEGGFRRLLLGSVTDKVIRGSDRPVLVYRPPQNP